MKYYRSYFDRQRVSPEFHQKLLNLERAQSPKPRRRGVSYTMKFGALAACAALLIGVGSRVLVPGPTAPSVPGLPEGVSAPSQGGTVSDPIAFEPSLGGDAAPADPNAFTAAGPAGGSKLMFPNIYAVDYADATKAPEIAASIAFPNGAFSVDLTKEDVQKLFWGPKGKPAVENPKADPGDFPIMLMSWAGYTVTGRATYDGNGDLWELRVWGRKGEDSFVLRAAPGRVPPTCLVEDGAAVTQVNGAEVSGWYRSYDRDGDDIVEHVCTSEFLANGVGFRFENVGSGGLKAGEDEAGGLGGAMRFNEMAVTQLCHTDGFYLDQFARSENIPAWAEVNFETLKEALSDPEFPRFAPYLPAQGPEGYGEFFGHRSYQEGNHDQLWLRWTKGYDDVEVEVHLPEGDDADYLWDYLVDASVPASYDWRLYDGPISDSVPREYRDHFYKPAFRAGDMSLEIVKARMTGKDTGGESCRFYVLHDNGAAVSYNCSGVSAEYVWSLVEPTLKDQ